MNNNRETKDIELFGETNTQPKGNNIKSFNNESTPPKKDDHSFYDPKSTYGKVKQAWRKKWVKCSVIWGSVVAVALAVGLGVGLGINWGGSRNKINFTPSFGITQEELDKWIKERGNYVGIKTDRLTDAAILREFEALTEAGSFNVGTANRYLKTAENKAKDQISREKDDFRTTHGSKWGAEWKKKLIEDGFDNEEEYKDSIISKEIKSKITALYTGKKKLVWTDGASSNKYKSTVKDKYNKKYRSLSNSYTEGRINVEDYYDLYLLSQKPIGTNKISAGFEFVGEPLLNGYDGQRIKFNSVDDIKTMWYLMRDMNAGEVFIDYRGYDSNLSGGIKRLGSKSFDSESQISSGNFYSTIFLGKNSPFGDSILNDGENNWTEAMNKSIFDVLNPKENVSWPEDMNNVKTEDFNLIETTDLEQIGTKFFNIVNPLFNGAINNKRNMSFTFTSNSTDTLFQINETGISITKVNGIDDFDTGIASTNLHKIATDYTSNDLSYEVTTDDTTVKDQPEYGILGDFDSWFNSSFDTFTLNDALTDKEFAKENFDVEDDLATYDEVVLNMYSEIYMDTYDVVKGMTWDIEDFLEENDTLFIKPTTTNYDLLNQTLVTNLVFYSFATDPEGKYTAMTIKDIILNDGNLNGANS